MDEHPTITRTPTEVGGLQVLAIEQAVGPHPHPDKGGALVPFRGVQKALLEDGSEVYLCEGNGRDMCPFVGDSTRSVASHRSGTHNRRLPRPGSDYPAATLRRLATEVVRARREGVRGSSVRAAEALNAAGIKTLSGQPWNAANVSHVYNDHCKQIRVHLPRDAAEATQRRTAKVGAALNSQIAVLEENDLAVVRQFVQILPRLGQALTRIADYVEAAEVTNQQMADKAARYDEMRALLNGRPG